MISWIKKYILPKEIDFITALQTQAMGIKKLTDDLQKCFINKDENHCILILQDERETGKIQEENMKNLLNSFITPIDRESIYRVITQLDWIAISIKHFVKEAKAYGKSDFDDDYNQMFEHLKLQAELLLAGFETLKKSSQNTAKSTKRVRDIYDSFMDIYIHKMAKCANLKNHKEIFINKELLSQLHDISRHFKMSADSLEDIVMKMA